MKSILTTQDIIYLLEQQERLDLNVRKEFNINPVQWVHMDDEHIVALSVELHEFFNETKAFKYWSKKTIDRQRLLEEAVDVIHFIMLNVNKSGKEHYFIDCYHDYVLMGDKNPLKDKEEVVSLMVEMITAPEVHTREDLDGLLHDVLRILDFYDFDRKQIMQAYKEKNKVNFERLAKGY